MINAAFCSLNLVDKHDLRIEFDAWNYTFKINLKFIFRIINTLFINQKLKNDQKKRIST